MASRLLVAFLFVLLGIIDTNRFALGYLCTFTDPKTGEFYDLSPLTDCTGNGYSLKTDGFTYTINFCQSLNFFYGATSWQSDPNTAANLGVLFAQQFSADGAGLKVHYSQGDECPDPLRFSRETTVELTCNTNVNFSFVSVEEYPQCHYTYRIESKYACPTVKGPQKLVCPSPNLPSLNVFVVPHTHDDVGWLKTIDGYFSDQVHYVIDTAIQALMVNPDRKFIYVEQAYFTRWWNHPSTTETQKKNLRQLVKEKRWEFVLGGWVMQDEAVTSWTADIDQMTQGHQFLKSEFGVIPREGWQIDPFGASSATPIMFQKMGFRGHIIDRINYQLEQTLKDKKLMEFTWYPSSSLNTTSIFTHILWMNYCFPMLQGFDFEDSSNALPVNEKNVINKAVNLANIIRTRAAAYRSNNVLIPYGCDFHFVNAFQQFDNFDPIMSYLINNPQFFNLTMQYATLSEYFDAVQSSGIQFPTVQPDVDFFPYDDGPQSWWTGYFTSRPALKLFVRQSEAILRNGDTLYSTGRVYVPSLSTPDNFRLLDKGRAAQSEAQHHDGVTGTERGYVVDMYTQDLEEGNDASFKVMEDTLSNLIAKGTTKPDISHKLYPLLRLKTGEVVAVVLYNSLGWNRTEFTQIPLNRNDVKILDVTGNAVPFQVNPAVFSSSSAKYTAFFLSSVPALGYNTYFVTTSAGEVPVGQVKTFEPQADSTIENNFLKLTFSGSNNRLSQIVNKKSGLSVPIDQNFMEYNSSENDYQSRSNVYNFRSNGTAHPLSKTKNPTISVVTGPYVQEVHQVFPSDASSDSYAEQTVRIYKTPAANPLVENFVDVQHSVGVLPYNKEVIISYASSLQTKGAFFTDDNGYHYLPRKRSHDVDDTIAGNYYPSVYGSYIQDQTARLTLLSDSSHGVSSQKDGQLEAMLHRRMIYTGNHEEEQKKQTLKDNFPDPNWDNWPYSNDTTIVRPSFRVVLDTPAKSPLYSHVHTYFMNFPGSVFAAKTSSISDWVANFNPFFEPIHDLPFNVHLLSLKALDKDSKTNILRLTHLFAKGEDPSYSKAVDVDLNKLFYKFKISSVTEVTLSANDVIGPVPNNVVHLEPKDIRTFLISFN